MSRRTKVGSASRVTPGESVVPVGERMRVTQLMRAAGIGLVLLCAALAPESLVPYRTAAVKWTLGYALVVALSVPLQRVFAQRLVVLFGAMLIIDGVWLAWVTYLTGGLTSPLRYAVLLHLGAVALLASYRTGLKLAMWHSLLLVTVYNGQRGGVLVTTDVRVPGTGSQEQHVVVFVVVLWLVAVSTSALSAVNERELRRRRMDLEALTELAEQLERTTDSASVARALLDSAVESFGFQRGVVVAGPDGQLPLLASFGLDDQIARRPGRAGSSAAVAQAAHTHQTVLVEDLDAADDAWLSTLLPGARNLVVVPLSAEGRPMGALVLEPASRSSSRARVKISRRVVSGLERSSSYAALALRNAWLLEQVQSLAATDGLTKIANRRTFESTLEREVARATRSAEYLSLVMLDIDHFKRLNDAHGHQAGDEVLRNVAAALTVECRDFDTPARYGGEEFAVVLPGCGPDEARQIAERLRRAVSTAVSVAPITASAGVATYPSHAGDADTLVRAADDALYASKSAGRDCTSVSAGVPPEAQVDALLRRAVTQRLGRPALPAPGPAGSSPTSVPGPAPPSPRS